MIVLSMFGLWVSVCRPDFQELEPFFYARPVEMNLGMISTISRLAGSDAILL